VICHQCDLPGIPTLRTCDWAPRPTNPRRVLRATEKPRSPLADVRSAAGRKQPDLVPRCHGWCGSQKNTRHRQRRGDHGMVGHVAAAVPGQRPPEACRQLPMRSINARATASALYPSGSATTLA